MLRWCLKSVKKEGKPSLLVLFGGFLLRLLKILLQYHDFTNECLSRRQTVNKQSCVSVCPSENRWKRHSHFCEGSCTQPGQVPYLRTGPYLNAKIQRKHPTRFYTTFLLGFQYIMGKITKYLRKLIYSEGMSPLPLRTLTILFLVHVSFFFFAHIYTLFHKKLI